MDEATKARISNDGVSEPLRLCTPARAEALARVCEQACLQSDQFAWPSLSYALELAERPWFKSAHARVPELLELACEPALVEVARALLGPDVLLWGATPILRRPGARHPWHADTEHLEWPGVTIWLGLRNIEPRTSLGFVTGTHALGVSPDHLGIDCDDVEAVLAAARARLGDRARLVEPALHEGEFVVFEGGVWHGSHNTSEQARLAVTLQYARPDARVRIPLGFGAAPEWLDVHPPCVLVAGEDRFGNNRLVASPARAD